MARQTVNIFRPAYFASTLMLAFALQPACAQLTTDAWADGWGADSFNKLFIKCSDDLHSRIEVRCHWDKPAKNSYGVSVSASGIAHSIVEPGIAKTRVEAVGKLARSMAKAGASYGDTIIINSPGLSQTTGELTIGILFNYTAVFAFDKRPTSSIYYSVSQNLTATSVGTFASSSRMESRTAGWSIWNYAIDSHTFDGDNNGVPIASEEEYWAPMYTTLSFTYGEPIRFDYRMSTTLLASGHYSVEGNNYYWGSADGLIDFGNSSYWAGITNVTSNGSIVPFTIYSESGINWINAATPVPEASEFYLLITGLVSILCLRNRKWRQRIVVLRQLAFAGIVPSGTKHRSSDSSGCCGVGAFTRMKRALAAR